MIDVRQFREIVVRPTLAGLDMDSAAAEDLVVGTALVESGLGYLRQLGGGPALSVFQVEPATAHDVLRRYLDARPDLRRRFNRVVLPEAVHAQIVWSGVGDHDIAMRLSSDLRFACAVCRLRYWMVPEALPAAGDIARLARYWKRHYNTAAGAGDPADFVRLYRKHCRA